MGMDPHPASSAAEWVDGGEYERLDLSEGQFFEYSQFEGPDLTEISEAVTKLKQLRSQLGPDVFDHAIGIIQTQLALDQQNERVRSPPQIRLEEPVPVSLTNLALLPLDSQPLRPVLVDPPRHWSPFRVLPSRTPSPVEWDAVTRRFVSVGQQCQPAEPLVSHHHPPLTPFSLDEDSDMVTVTLPTSLSSSSSSSSFSGPALLSPSTFVTTTMTTIYHSDDDNDDYHRRDDDDDDDNLVVTVSLGAPGSQFK